MYDLNRRLAAEAIGAAFLVAAEMPEAIE